MQIDQLSPGIILAIVVAVALLIPFLLVEIRNGKKGLGPLRRLGRGGMTLGPVTPLGAGDNNPGRRGDPAPGQPDGQSDPWGPRAQRNGPPIQS